MEKIKTIAATSLHMQLKNLPRLAGNFSNNLIVSR